MKKCSLLIVLALFVSICSVVVCSAEGVFPGEYELTAISYGGSERDPGSMSMSGGLILREDGSGSFIMNNSEMVLSKWTEEGEILSLYNEAGEPLECTYADGIVTMEMGPDYYWYFYHESINPNAGKEVSRLDKVLEKIDAAAGAHLNYEYHSDYMDSVSLFDVHAKGDSYYSAKTLKVSGHEGLSANVYKDGTVYLLHPDKKEGSKIMSVSMGLLRNNVLLLDDCYKLMANNVMRKDFSVEERELDGKKFTVEVFPAADPYAGIAFYFDNEGQLIHILEDAPIIMPSMGETFYTIHIFDDAVNESLFDISGYTIE